MVGIKLKNIWEIIIVFSFGCLHIVQSRVRWEGVVAEKFDPIPAEI